MRRGQLGLAIRDVMARLATVRDALIASANDPELLDKAHQELTQLDEERQRLLDELNRLGQAQTELQALAARSGWGDDIPASFEAFSRQLDVVRTDLARREGMVMPQATPSFVTAHDGECANCGAEVPAGATAGFVDDELWCQPCRCELAAKQDLHIDDFAAIQAFQQRQRRYAKAWEQAARFANEVSDDHDARPGAATDPGG